MEDEQESPDQLPHEPEMTEREQLEQEKTNLARKLGISGVYNPVPNFQQTNEFKRIEEINERLWVLAKG